MGSVMRIDLVGVVGPHSDTDVVEGQDLGGRRASVALAALARQPVSPSARIGGPAQGDDLGRGTAGRCR